MLKIMILGGQGFLGLYLGHYFTDRGHLVALVDRTCSYTGNKIPNQFGGDMSKRSFIEGCFTSFKPDIVLHIPKQNFTTVNAFVKEDLASLATLSEIPKYSLIKVMYLSSVSTVASSPPSRETVAFSLAERLCLSFSEFEIVRTPLIAGPKPNHGDDFLNETAHLLLQGKSVNVLHKDSTIHVLSVETLADFLLKRMFEKKEDAVNVISEAHKIGPLLNSMQKLIGHGCIIYDDTQIAQVPTFKEQVVTLKGKITKPILLGIIEKRKEQLRTMGYVET
jgi:nucleoside-diphosphate-sugar epimerase